MAAKYTFDLQSRDKRRPLPNKILLGQGETETLPHVLLKFLAYVLFYRERIQIEASLHNDSIPFTPDLVQLDYELRPRLWVECGECSLAKLNKLAVKVPDADIWVVKGSVARAEALARAMAGEELRRHRYGIIGFDDTMFDELLGLLGTRNRLLWVSGEFDPPQLQFDFNGLWFDAPFAVFRH